jgi:hypothetical protein
MDEKLVAQLVEMWAQWEILKACLRGHWSGEEMALSLVSGLGQPMELSMESLT